MNRLIINIGLKGYIFYSKYIVISINSIMLFHESRDYKYWTNKIYSKFKIYSHFNEFNQAAPYKRDYKY